jgi:hypothetical protein
VLCNGWVDFLSQGVGGDVAGEQRNAHAQVTQAAACKEAFDE